MTRRSTREEGVLNFFSEQREDHLRRFRAVVGDPPTETTPDHPRSFQRILLLLARRPSHINYHLPCTLPPSSYLLLFSAVFSSSDLGLVSRYEI